MNAYFFLLSGYLWNERKDALTESKCTQTTGMCAFVRVLIIPQECMKDNSGQEGTNLLNGLSIVPTEPPPF